MKQLATQAEANRLVREYIATDKSLQYVDVATPMLGADGKPRKESFGPDGLHMNGEGYKLWTSILTPILKEVCAAGEAREVGQALSQGVSFTEHD